MCSNLFPCHLSAKLILRGCLHKSREWNRTQLRSSFARPVVAPLLLPESGFKKSVKKKKPQNGKKVKTILSQYPLLSTQKRKAKLDVCKSQSPLLPSMVFVGTGDRLHITPVRLLVVGGVRSCDISISEKSHSGYNKKYTVRSILNFGRF